jgi:hypothetical protein
MKIEKCGSCIGCQIDADLARAVSKIDEFFAGRMRRLGACAREDDVVRRLRRESSEQREKFIAYAIKTLRPTGCLNFRVIIENVEDFG